MINRVIAGISTIIFRNLDRLRTQFHSDNLSLLPMHEWGKCTWAAKAEFGVGVLIVFLGTLLAFAESREIRMGLSIALGFIGMLSVLIAKSF